VLFLLFPSSLLFLPLLRLQLSLRRPYHPVSTSSLAPPPPQMDRFQAPPTILSHGSTNFLKFLDLMFHKSDLFTSASLSITRTSPLRSRLLRFTLLSGVSPYDHHAPKRVPHAPTSRSYLRVHTSHAPMRGQPYALCATLHHLPPPLPVSNSGSHPSDIHCHRVVFYASASGY
jgi:hypothetical protein